MSIIVERKNLKNVFFLFDDKDPLYVEHTGYHKLSAFERRQPAVHPYYLLHLIVNGSGFFYYEGKTKRLNAGEAFIIAPGELAFYKPDDDNPWEYYWIAFSGSFAETLVNRTIKHRVMRYKESGILSLQSSLIGDDSSISTLNILFNVLDSIQETSSQSNNEQQDIVSSALHFLEHNYPDDIQIEKLANSLGYSRAHFTMLFTKKTGVSPYYYLTQIRINKAKELLITTKLSIEEISYSVGFSCVGRFSEIFKKYESLSPMHYRKENDNLFSEE